MIRSKLAIFTLAAPSFLALAAAPRGELASVQDCPDLLQATPIVTFDVSGFTLAGPLHTHLVVYDNGLAALSSAGGFPGSGDGTAEFEFLPPADALGLLSDLRAAHAFELCDDTTQVADLPLTTVTVMTPGSDSKAHSFSYWIPSSPRHHEVAQTIADFIDRSFPGS
jgi:hypothetical protein